VGIDTALRSALSFFSPSQKLCSVSKEKRIRKLDGVKTEIILQNVWLRSGPLKKERVLEYGESLWEQLNMLRK
jgi:hypothetical protein